MEGLKVLLTKDKYCLLIQRQQGAVTIAGATSATTHEIEIAVEFKPVEHLIEPLDNDQTNQFSVHRQNLLFSTTGEYGRSERLLKFGGLTCQLGKKGLP